MCEIWFRIRAVLGGTALWLVAYAGRAETVTFTAQLGGGATESGYVTSLVLTPEPRGVREPIQVSLPVPGTVSVDLLAEVKWRVENTTAKLWTRPLMISVKEAASHVLTYLPAGIVTGHLRDDRGGLPGAELTVAFSPAGVRFPVAADISRCSVDEASRFRCSVPFGRHHLRWKTPQRTPSYKWSQEIRDVTDVGRVLVNRGGTIAGYLAVSDVPDDPKDAKITVRRSVLAAGKANGRYEDAPARVELASDGFFVSPPLAEGVYELVVETLDRGAAVSAIHVRDGLEARLPRELALTPRVGVSIRFNPPRTPTGSPWDVEVVRSADEGNEPMTRGTASTEGVFVANHLSPGRHQVLVTDERGSRWASQVLSVSSPAREVLIEIPSVDVHGSLRRGEERVKAFLWFGGQQGTPSILLETDGHGRFAGALPRAGEWVVDVVIPPADTPLSVDAQVIADPDTGDIRADVRLPNTVVEGVVVDSRDMPVAQAEVELRTGPRQLAVARTNADGRFAVRGIATGVATVMASASGARSMPASVNVAEDANAPMRLVVHPLPPLRSRVVGPGGPVPGARVAVWPEDGGLVSLAVTDSEGYFVVMGHPPMQRLFMAVHAMGLAIALDRISGDPTSYPSQITLSSATGTLEITAAAPISHVEHDGVVLPAQLALRLLTPVAFASEGLASVRLGDLPPGQYRACSQMVTAVATCAEGWLAPGGTSQIRIPAEPRAE